MPVLIRVTPSTKRIDMRKSSPKNPASPINNHSNNAKNALNEAAARKRNIDQASANSKDEKNGRKGLDPARFGDWEVKGIASDF